MKTLKEEREAIVETLSVKEVHLVGGFTETKSVIKCSQEQLRTALLSHEEKVRDERDTHWKERVRKEVEVMASKTVWNAEGKPHISAPDLLQALDNLK